MPTTLYILIPLIILFAFIAALVKIRTWHIRKNAGAYGEKSVVKTLSKCALPDDKLLNNVTLVNPQNEMSAQIDHIFISTRGIFVIETKKLFGIYLRKRYSERVDAIVKLRKNRQQILLSRQTKRNAYLPFKKITEYRVSRF